MNSSPTLVIPPRLDAKLGRGSELAEAVRLSLAQVSLWIGDSTQGLFFFPEYTDHGPVHINRVLSAACALVMPAAWKLVTVEDAAVLILATLLHDAAMHLSADGLLALIGAPPRPLVVGCDTETWPKLFNDFLFEAGDRARVPEEEGDLANVPRHVEECPNPETWTVQYRKFLGEFLRRHHARLAHEIACWGVPTSGSQPLTLALSPTLSDWAELAGLVARSHNIPLRDTFTYLMARFHGRVLCRGCHPVFLMVLLRIADYLEIEANRANSTQLRVRRLRSPISKEEWAPWPTPLSSDGLAAWKCHSVTTCRPGARG